MNDSVIQVAQDSLEKAKFYTSITRYGRAFAHYLVYLELNPNLRQCIVKEFTDVLYNWTSTLENLKQYEDLVKCYLQGMHYFPSNIEIINNFGAHLIRLNQYNKAQKYLKLAYMMDNEYLPVEKNVITVKLNLLPRWHFRMLNDYKRNISFKNAIFDSIDEKFNKVLDIGTGTGILSLIAKLNNKVKLIYAIEENETLYKIAKKVIKSNKMTNIKLLNKNSTELSNLTKSNILITEIFDTALFGEHVLKALIHAHENLLDENAKIIPKSSKMYITGIECTQLYNKHKYAKTHNLLNLNNFCLSAVQNLPYDAENLKLYKYKVVTNSHEIFVNFSNLSELKNLYENVNALNNIKLKIIEPNCTIHAFVIWFDLNLDERNKITTNPFDENNSECWEQAILYLDHPFQGRDSICLKLSVVKDKLKIKILNKQTCRTNCYKVSQEIITFLNDTKLMNSFCNSTYYFLEKTNLTIMDLNPFPLFGLLLAKQSSKVVCLVNNGQDELFLRQVCDMNNIQNVIFLREMQIAALLKEANIFNVILLNPIATEGIINEKYIRDFLKYRNLLKPNGIIIPERVWIVLKIIDSDYVRYFNKADDKNCLGFKIAEFINEYAVSEQWMIIPKELPHNSLSENIFTVNIMQNDNDAITKSYQIEIQNSGKANGILYWYRINQVNDILFDSYNSSHYNSACFLLDNEKIVQEQSVIEITVKQHKGLLKIF